MKVSKRSMLTGKTNTMDLPVTANQLEAFEKGYASFETLFANLTPAQKEFLQSGITEEEIKTT